MKKLSDDQKNKLGDLRRNCANTGGAVASATDAYHDTLEEIQKELDGAWEKIQLAQDPYNKALKDLSEYCEEIAGLAEAYADEKSQPWNESEEGGAHREWGEQWSRAAEEIQPIELEPPGGVAETFSVELWSCWSWGVTDDIPEAPEEW